MNTHFKERIAPGMWRDWDGNVHYSIPELLAMIDLEDTPENRAEIERMLRESILKRCPDAKIIHRKQNESGN